jgi:hypothetical protein
MRLRIITVVALAACTHSDNSDPTAQVLKALVAKNQFDCGGYDITTQQMGQPGCLDQAHAQPALDCMNDALASGGRAEFSVGGLDINFFAEDTVMLTVDNAVRIFVDYPGGDGHHYGEYAVEQPTCTGPFEIADAGPVCYSGAEAFNLYPDGCP